MYHIQNAETDLTIATADTYQEAIHLALTLKRMNAFTVVIVLGAGAVTV